MVAVLLRRSGLEQALAEQVGALGQLVEVRLPVRLLDEHHGDRRIGWDPEIPALDDAVDGHGEPVRAVRQATDPDDPRVVDSTGALQLRQVPKRMLILGGGIIGLEMGTVYSTLGARLDVVEMMDGLMQGADRDLVKIWQKMNAKRFDNIMLKTKTVSARALPEGIEVTFAPAEEGGTASARQV